MAKEPFLPLFFGDFLASTAEWEGEERALYLLLLGYQWSLGSLPAEPRRICKLVAWDWALFERCWQTVGPKFQGADRLTNPRLEYHRARGVEISRGRSEAGRIGNEVRWSRDRKVIANAKDDDRKRDRISDKKASQGYRKGDRNGSQTDRNGDDFGIAPSHPIPSQSIPDKTLRRSHRWH